MKIESATGYSHRYTQFIDVGAFGVTEQKIDGQHSVRRSECVPHAPL